MKKLSLILLTIALASCEKDEQPCETCEGQFVSIETGEYIHQPTDCERVPPDGYVFVKCLGKPTY